MGRRKKKIEPYTLPDSLLGQLTEHCNHGFLLLTYDNEDNYRIYSNFDGEIPFKALKADTLKWLNSIEQIEQTQTLHGILGHQE